MVDSIAACGMKMDHTNILKGMKPVIRLLMMIAHISHSSVRLKQFFAFRFSRTFNIPTWSFQLSGRVEYYSFLRRRQRKNRLEIKLNELLLLGILW